MKNIILKGEVKMNLENLTYDDCVGFFESEEAKAIPKELRYLWDVANGCVLIEKSMIRTLKLIEVLLDESENLTLEGFCYQSNIELKLIEKKINEFDAITALHGTKLTKNKVSKTLGNAFNTMKCVFDGVISHSTVNERILERCLQDRQEVEIAIKDFLYNCNRYFGKKLNK